MEQRQRRPGEGLWLVDLAVALFIATLFGLGIEYCGKAHAAGYEEVTIINVQQVNQMVCPEQPQVQQSAGIAGTGVSGKQAVGTAAGAGLGYLAGKALFGNSTTAKVVGAVAGGAAGYGLTSDNKPQPQQANCQNVLKYKTTYRRMDGSTGELLMSSRTTATTMVINFCPGVQGQLERPC